MLAEQLGFAAETPDTPMGFSFYYDELQDYIRKGLTVHFAETYEDVRGLVF